MTLSAIPLALWDHHPPHLRPIHPPIALGGAGGLSGSALWRVETESGPIAVRLWHPGTTTGRLTRIHRWVDRLGAIPEVAAPLVDRSGGSFHEADGRLWELTRFLPGDPDLGQPPEPTHLAIMFAALGRVHDALSLELTLAPSPGLIARRDELRQLIAWEFRAFRRVLASYPPSESRWYAHEWINRAEPVAGRVAEQVAAAATRVRPLQPVLRDARPDHFLFERDRLTGLIDFGAMGVESVASDLARLIGESVGCDRGARELAVAAYQQVRPLATEDRALIRVFEAANAVLGAARWVRWLFVEDRRFDDPAAAEARLIRSCRRFSDDMEMRRKG